VLHTPALRLQTPTAMDIRIMFAAASDPQAQHWFGWTSEFVIPERKLVPLLALSVGQGPALPPESAARYYLAAVALADGWAAGAISIDPATNEVGGWLAPRFRGRGLGAGLFAGAAEFAHQHLGVPVVTAGTESSNAACIASLLSAGFIPAAGPESHTLPNGRVISSRWFRHESPQPTSCGT
jgi:RimJ/RimL family protein N-acetyltransferase